MRSAIADGRTVSIIGWPIGHSRSPLIHNYWINKHGLDGTYVKRGLEPGAALSAYFDEMRGGRHLGCNVTMPHKAAVAALIDDVLPEARSVGAVNTVWRVGRRLIGTSTDGPGWLAHLDLGAPGWRAADGLCVVLGAGGASRAIVDSLLRLNVGQVVVLNRTAEKAETLVAGLAGAHKVGSSRIVARDWTALASAIGAAKLIVNTTSLGMTGHAPLDIDLGPAPDTCTVSDIVYAPLETPLLATARARGLAVSDGLGMLLHQAVPGFEKWFGVRPVVTDELRALVVADLAGH